MNARRVSEWTVDYGDGPRPCQVPHNWTREADLRWEGPALYRTSLDCGKQPGWLVFHGASYRADVAVDGTPVLSHTGIWDAFTVALPPGKHEVAVTVTKNGGPSYPVRNVLSGFLPYVYGTFGGLYREVELHSAEPDLEPPAPPCRIEVEGSSLRLDGKPWEMRGVLSWGWHPEVGAPQPELGSFRESLRTMKALGLNTWKACLWLPPHAALRALDEEGLLAWLELPLWMPATDPASLDRALEEVGRIVRQYRSHRCIVAWSFGCELSRETPHEFRKRLVELGEELTGAALFKDSSGGSEMYGGDLREYGSFEDFHPYCDAQWYPPVLEALRSGARRARPILLGEFNDYDALRPLAPLRSEYWASSDPAANDQGVRWQHDLPDIVHRGIPLPDESELAAASLRKGRWMRKHAVRSAMSQPGVQGYVLTGIHDTPISSSGILETGRFEAGDFQSGHAFLIPPRQMPWEAGGNRSGWHWPYVQPAGEGVVRVGIRSEAGYHGRARVVLDGCALLEGDIALAPGVPSEIAQVALRGAHGHRASLTVDWELRIEDLEIQFWSAWEGRVRFTPRAAELLRVEPGDEGPLVALDVDREPSAAVVLSTQGPSRPFFRECIHRGLSAILPEDAYDSWLCVAASHTIAPDWLAEHGEGWRPVVERVDTRNYGVEPVVVQRPGQVIAALRVGGGEGVQPSGLASNPAGAEVLRRLLSLAREE